MTKQEWLTALIVAVGVAVLTMGVTAPPVCWAEPTAAPVVPELPPTELTIPSISARVSASATPAPGQPVKVMLALTSPSGSDLTRVPVTVTVLSTTMDPDAREMPKPVQVTKVDTDVPVGPDGNGSTVVDLPLTWAIPAPPPAPETADSKDAKRVLRLQRVTSYQMVLSSTLGGKAAPADLQALDRSNIPRNVIPIQAPQPEARNPILVPVQPVDIVMNFNLLSFLSLGGVGQLAPVPSLNTAAAQAGIQVGRATLNR